MVVMPDADLEQAVDALIGAAYGSAGERCMAISVAVLVGDIAERMLPQLAERARALRIKNGMQPDAEMGPVDHAGRRSSASAATSTIGVAERRAAARGRPLRSGERRALRRPRPRERLLDRRARSSTTSRRRCASTGRRSSARCCAACACRTSRRRVELVNAHEFGQRRRLLSRATATSRASSRGASRSAWSASTCRSRCRWPGTASAAGRASLFGDMHAYGEEGVRFYTRQKSIMQRWPESTPKGAEFAMPTSK